MKLIPSAILLAAALPFGAGCTHHHETVYKDVERTKVEFENDRAARVFYEALSQRPAVTDGSESETSVSLPIIFEHKRHVKPGPNTAFNQAVMLCDSNKDGRITELEAKIFAEQTKKP